MMTNVFSQDTADITKEFTEFLADERLDESARSNVLTVVTGFIGNSTYSVFEESFPVLATSLMQTVSKLILFNDELKTIKSVCVQLKVLSVSTRERNKFGYGIWSPNSNICGLFTDERRISEYEYIFTPKFA